jgi:hypothetical protein
VVSPLCRCPRRLRSRRDTSRPLSQRERSVAPLAFLGNLAIAHQARGGSGNYAAFKAALCALESGCAGCQRQCDRPPDPERRDRHPKEPSAGLLVGSGHWNRNGRRLAYSFRHWNDRGGHALENLVRSLEIARLSGVCTANPRAAGNVAHSDDGFGSISPSSHAIGE